LLGAFSFDDGMFMNTSRAAISLASVSKHYGSKAVIHDVSFDVKKGEIVGFLGPNGAGKTTTMRMIAGFTTATSGRVTVLGYDMATEHQDAARQIGYLPEHPPLYDVLDVATYLGFVARVKSIHRRAVRGEVDRVITACGLEAVVHREIFKLSKGYRQRVGLAQALLGDPAVLLLDEPTAGLDPAQIHETRETIRQAGQSCAVLLSTHILPEATLICQRVAVIIDGRLLAIDSPDRLQRASEHSSNVELEVTAPSAELRDALQSIDGVHGVSMQPIAGRESAWRVECHVDAERDVEAQIARTIAARWSLHRIDRRQPTLENVFLRYMREAQQVPN
jgi:ABC-2 type transport system ATP-binding protein